MTDYSKQWAEYRRLRNLELGVVLSMTLLATSSPLISRWIQIWPGLIWVLLLLGAAVLSAGIIVFIRVNDWRCPRCGRSFVSNWMNKFMVFFAEKCANCELPKYANDDSRQS